MNRRPPDQDGSAARGSAREGGDLTGEPGATPSYPDLDRYRLVDAPGHLLRRCQQRAVELFAEELGPRRVTPRQFALLITVYQRPGLTQTGLVGVTGIDRSTVGDMLDRLVRRGLIKRKRSGIDQRANTLYILPPGVEMLRGAVTLVDRVQARILEPVPAELRASLIAALKLMAGFADPGLSSRQEE